jgi:hypothetical protein
MKDLAARLTGEFGSGFSLLNLRNFRQFFLIFPGGITPGKYPGG